MVLFGGEQVDALFGNVAVINQVSCLLSGMGPKPGRYQGNQSLGELQFANFHEVSIDAVGGSAA